MTGRIPPRAYLCSVVLCAILGGMRKHDEAVKLKTIRLRKKGLSYNEIRKQVKVTKSTLSLWLKGIRLAKNHRLRLYTKQIQYLSLGSQSQKERRAREVEGIIEIAEKEIRVPLSFETLRLLGAALYWAEGSKGKRFEITNSDPYFILFIVKWLETIFKIFSKDLKARLNIYPQQNEGKIKKFWSALTGIPLESFGKSYVKPLSKNYKKNNLYYGTIRIEVPRSTDLRYRVFGWIKAIMKNIQPRADLVQKQWRYLRASPRPVNLENEHP